MEPTLFDVIGPVMVGPSSSHTAGALRIALITRKLCPNKDFEKVTFTLYGSFAETFVGHGTDKALLGGILGFSMDDVRVRESFKIADEQGLKYEYIPDRSSIEYHPNTVKIHILCKDKSTFTVIGESIGGGLAVLRNINGIDVKISGEYNTLLTIHRDLPGVFAHVASIFDAYNINIAFIRLYREEKGKRAFGIIETDDEISLDVTKAVAMHPAIINAIKFDVKSLQA